MREGDTIESGELKSGEVELVRRFKGHDDTDISFVRVSGTDAERLEKVMNSRIRNIIANEFGLRRQRGSGQRPGIQLSGEATKQMVNSYLDNTPIQKIIDREFQKLVRPMVEKAIQEKIEEVLEPVIREAARNFTFECFNRQAKDENTEKSAFGRF